MSSTDWLLLTALSVDLFGTTFSGSTLISLILFGEREKKLAGINLNLNFFFQGELMLLTASNITQLKGVDFEKI